MVNEMLIKWLFMYACWGYFFYVAMTGIKWPLWFKVTMAIIWPVIIIFWITGIIKEHL